MEKFRGINHIYIYIYIYVCVCVCVCDRERECVCECLFPSIPFFLSFFLLLSSAYFPILTFSFLFPPTLSPSLSLSLSVYFAYPFSLFSYGFPFCLILWTFSISPFNLLLRFISNFNLGFLFFSVISVPVFLPPFPPLSLSLSLSLSQFLSNFTYDLLSLPNFLSHSRHSYCLLIPY